MYSVEIDDAAVPQISALPTPVLKTYAELITVLELHPWSGEPYGRQNPSGNMRTRMFGDRGQGWVIYLILDDQRRVIVLRVLWIDLDVDQVDWSGT